MPLEKRQCKECGEWFVPKKPRQQFCEKEHFSSLSCLW